MFKNRHTGVTMIELIIVIAIVAILVALAIPSFTMYFEKARLRGAADDIVALLAEARQAAVRENKQVGMSVMLTGTELVRGRQPGRRSARSRGSDSECRLLRLLRACRLRFASVVRGKLSRGQSAGRRRYLVPV